MGINLGVKPVGRTIKQSSLTPRQSSRATKPIAAAIAQKVRQQLGRFRVVWMMLLASLLLSGCVQYDVGINFESPNRGEIVQHIKLGDRLTSLSGATAQQWLNTVEQRTRRLGGRIRRSSNQEVAVTIPFSSGADLNTKFNEFLNPSTQKGAAKRAEPVLPEIKSDFHLSQSNFLLLLRNRLSYTLDLRSLGVTSANGDLLVSPSSLLDLEFRLNTPWGARSVNTAANAISAVQGQQGHQLVWTLEPGQINHLEAVFWLPSPLGIGTVVIVLLVLGGWYLKYQTLPGLSAGSTQVSTSEG
ncbi:MAG: DUF3153 domain-containing protein [Trichocoleus desertorum ATA4-8-CV12]|nr:DUF3153 domain-containing protein [Trichocoleus desertorum ATA4-8-CV12]